MLDQATSQGRIVRAAMNLAAERSWRDVTLADIAASAGAALVELKQDFSSKAGILATFTRAVDDEVLRRAPRRAAGQASRDALFEVLMTRFDVLLPYRAALRSIVQGSSADPAQLKAVLASQHWMLEAAGIDTSGIGGGVRVAGLASVYASVFHTWLLDDDPGQARTMAALDRRLRGGERSLRMVEDACAVARRVGDMLRPASRRASAPPPPPPAAEPAPPPATGIV